MKTNIFTCLLLTVGSIVNAQQSITNLGNLQIHPNAIMSIHGNLTNTASAALVNNGSLHVKKDITNAQSNMATGAGTLLLNGNSTQSLNGVQAIKTYNLVTNNGSGIQLNSDLSVSGLHTYTTGMITGTTAPNYLIYEAGASYTGSNDSRHVNGWVQKKGNTDFVFPVGTNTLERSISINNLSSNSTFAVQYAAPTPNANQKLAPIVVVNTKEYWTINKLTGGTATVTMNWSHNKVPFNAWRLQDLVAAGYDGSQWVSHEGVASGDVFTSGSVTSSSVSNFGLFTIASKSTALPLTLLSFDAKRINDYTQLYWKTNNEQNVAYFLVQRSEDGVRYTNIYEQPARNSGVVEHYSAEDTKPMSKVVYYRLKMIDRTGVEKLSQVVKIGVEAIGNGLTLLINPVKDKLTLLASNELSGGFYYNIVSMNGQLIQNGNLLINRSSKVEVPLKRDIKPGTYTLVVTNSMQSFTIRFVVQ
jgi:hypothetical protein